MIAPMSFQMWLDDQSLWLLELQYIARMNGIEHRVQSSDRQFQ